MNLFEYQAKSLLEEFGVPTPRSLLIQNAGDLEKIKDGLFPSGYVVKAQVFAGGRGKAGGVQIARSAEEAKAKAQAMLGATLATHQTKGKALAIDSVLVAERLEFHREFYLAVVLDRKASLPTMLASRFGGMEIEEIAKSHPEAIIRASLPVEDKLDLEALKNLIKEKLEFQDKKLSQFTRFLEKLHRLYLARELMLLEINPLAETKEGFVALDAKVAFDENALFRQQKNSELAYAIQAKSDSLERKAKELGISYIPIGGAIGCLVNGAGLAMATMDLIAQYKLSPANFLDVGGGADLAQVQGAFEILFSNRELTAIFVNIFGGIMRCDIIASALVEANKTTPLRVPLVARLQGTKMDEAHQILKEAEVSGVQIFVSLDEAVKALVQATLSSPQVWKPSFGPDARREE